MLELPDMVFRLGERAAWEPRDPPIPDRSGGEDRYRPRYARPPVRPSPNAPLLLRIVKTPYREHPGMPVRLRLLEPPSTRRRVPFAALREDRTATRRRSPFRSPAVHRPRPGERPTPRGLAETWIRTHPSEDHPSGSPLPPDPKASPPSASR